MEQILDNLPEDLAEKWLQGTLTPEEQVIFDQWYEAFSTQEVQVTASSRESFRDLMLEHIQHARAPMAETSTGKPVRTIKKAWLLPVVIAAASIIFAFVLLNFIGSDGSKGDQGRKMDMAQLAQMIPPGGNKAVLTLADGQTIILDTAANGQLTRQGNITVTKANSGLLVYSAGDRHLNTKSGADLGAGSAGVTFNTLRTPRGGKYNLELPDGTKVWLNAASSIRYPTAFTGSERKVAITGEVYFEVVHNEKMPFRVQAGKILVEDLGTQFVINAYSNEPAVKVSLVEGVVKVIPPVATLSKVLKPGWQASVDNGGKMQVNKQADVQAEMAWKSGLFNFSGADLKTIMRQLERWYDITVSYAPGLPDYHFGGQTYMNASLSEVLKVLELSGIHFKIEKDKNNQAVKLYIEP